MGLGKSRILLLSNMKRRTVSTISKYLEPKRIFEAITSKSWPYAPTGRRDFYECRDRAFMAMCLMTAARVTAILGGFRYLIKNECVECGGRVKRMRTRDSFAWICRSCGKNYGYRKPENIGDLVKFGEHPGLRMKNLVVNDDFIRVTEMSVIKRKRDTIEKHGAGITVRDDFFLPLRKGLFQQEYIHREQIIPFSWLLKEYLDRFMSNADLEKKLFGFKRGRGWQIIYEVTGWFPNWFRSQSEHFHGNFILKGGIKLAKWVKVVNPGQVAHYIGYDPTSEFKDREMFMDFSWIDLATEEIKSRIENS